MFGDNKHDESQASMSCDNAVRESTVCRWLKDKEMLCDFVDMVQSSDGINRRKTRTAKEAQPDKAVFTWFVNAR